MELAPFDSRANASRSHQELKRSRARWIVLGPSQEDEKASSEDLYLGLFLEDFIFSYNVKDRIVVDCSNTYTHTQS